MHIPDPRAFTDIDMTHSAILPGQDIPFSLAPTSPASGLSGLMAFLLRGWRCTLLVTLLGSLTVTAGVILNQGPLWLLALDWSVTLAYAALVVIGHRRA